MACGKISIASCLFALAALSACEKRPEGVLSEDKLIDVMADMEMADAYYNTGGSVHHRISKDVLNASVLEKHGVTQAEIDSTVAYYGRNIDDYYKIYAKVEDKLRKSSRGGDMRLTEEENNIWPYADYAMVFANQTSDGIVFSLPSTGEGKGEVLEWRMRLSNPEGVEGMLGVEYDNGNSSIIKRNAVGNKSFVLTLQTDTAREVNRIFGYMKTAKENMPMIADSIRLIKMEYDSLNYSKIFQQRTIKAPVRKPVEASPDSIEE